MFDISWGEIAVLGAVGVAVTGKKDLPTACRFVGTQLGRVVGLLQGARARADRFAHHNELKALQNELRSGLRELDQVKTELAVAASTKGVMGQNLGALTASANKVRPIRSTYKTPQSLSASLQHAAASPAAFPPISAPGNSTTIQATNSTREKNDSSSDNSHDNNLAAPLSLSDFDFHVENTEVITKNSSGSSSASDVSQMDLSQQSASLEPELSPAAQSEKAVMEEEWTKQGIGFKAQAEMGSWNYENNSDNSFGNDESIVDTTRATGSELLEHLERQCLIFDQYDRVVGEQEKEMEERVERIQNERRQKQTEELDDPEKKH